jgi:tetratricopeptide (TPR) repeat protein
MTADPRAAAEPELADVILAYLHAAEAGQTPDRRQLLQRHPQLVVELNEFFAINDGFELLAAPLREAVQGVAGTTSAADRTVLADSPLSSETALPAVGDYELLEEIGRGGMGVVYKARQRSLGRLVALKMIRGGPGASAADVARFRGEAETIASLNHDHIVAIYDVGEKDGRLYFTMKLIDGGSLDRDRGRFRDDPRSAARLLATVARAVHHAHQRGVLHRDLKPSNILLEAGDKAYVTDFGLAKRLRGHASPAGEASLTHSGDVLGSPRYMAPEQTAGRKAEVTTATDVYGLGVVLYVLLTGQPPFAGEDLVALLEQVTTAEPKPPRLCNRRVPGDLDTICLKCLQKEPGRRYGSAEALADDLERWLRGEPIRARPVARVERVWRWCRRNPALALLSVAAAAAVLVAVGVLLDSRVKIGRALQQEGRQRERAERSYRLAREGLEQCVQKVVDDPRLQGGPLEDLRRSIREAEKAFYERFVDLQGSDPAFQLERARVYRRLAFLSQELGSKDEAIEHYRRAVAISSKLAADHAEVTEYQADLWTSYNNLGEMCRQAARMQEAEQPLQDALGVARALVRDHPEDIEYQFDLARNQINRGLLFRETNRPKEAEQAYDEARAVLQAALGRHPDHAECQSELARAWHELGLVYKDSGRPKEAERAFEDSLGLRRALAHDHPLETPYRLYLARNLSNLGTWFGETQQLLRAEQSLTEAIALLRDLVQQHPVVPEYRHLLAVACVNLGNNYQGAGRFQEAERAKREGVTLLKQLADAAPTFPDYQYSLGNALHNLSTLYLLSDPGEARRLLEQAIACEQAALQANPKNPVYRFELRANFALLAEVLLRLGEHGEARKAALQVPAFFPDDWQAHTTAAVLLARCVPLAEKDATLTEGKRAETGREYADQTLAALRRAIDKGFRDGQALEQEPAFAPLRAREEFTQILAGLRKQEQR